MSWCFNRSFVSLSLEEKAFLLNPLGLGAQLQVQIGDRLNYAKELTDIVSVNTDITSYPCASIRVLDFLINLVGIRTEGSFGTSYQTEQKKELR
jgi:hypothetical protein